MVTYCRCSDNNRAQTVLLNFQQAEEEYGLPLKIRSDYGVEYAAVWRYMLEKRANSNALVVGSSVHNQRVERINRDVNQQVINRCYNEFLALDDAGNLDPNNITDLYCLHFAYLPVINKRLDEFVQGYNHHPLSTEGNYTPHQLFRMNYRLLQLQHLKESGSINLADITARSQNDVSVGIIPRVLTPTEEVRLREIIDNEGDEETHKLFLRVISFVATCLGTRN